MCQSRNWDGGFQEFSTAKSCVEAIFPGSEIIQNCVDVYPVRVIVSAHVGATNVKLWEGRQQDLFRKYASKRTKSIEDIKIALTEFKEDME